MAEPNPEYLKRISQLFCQEYNRINNTNFVFDEIEKIPSEVDFYIKDGVVRIPIQYSIIQSTPSFLKSAAQTAIVTHKIEEMAKIYGLNCTMSLVFNEVPLNDDEISKFVGQIMIFLSQHLTTKNFRPHFKKYDDLGLIIGIFNYLTEFEILSVGDSGFSLFIGNEAWAFSRSVDEDVDHHLKQIRVKDAKYCPSKQLILLLDTEPMPITGISLDELRNKCSLLKFNCKEIWQVNLGNEGFCDKIYPYNVEE